MRCLVPISIVALALVLLTPDCAEARGRRRTVTYSSYTAVTPTYSYSSTTYSSTRGAAYYPSTSYSRSAYSSTGAYSPSTSYSRSTYSSTSARRVLYYDPVRGTYFYR